MPGSPSPSLTVFLASVGLTGVMARTFATAGAAPPAKLSSRVLTLSGAALLTLAGCAGAKCSVRLKLVRVTVTAAVVLFSVVDYALSIGFGLARALRQHYRTFGASLAPGGATLLAGAPPPKPSVVVIGGSFAGLRVQRELGDDFDVTVVDLKEYFEYTPGVLRLYTQPEVWHTGLEPQASRPQAGLLLTRLSLALDSTSRRSPHRCRTHATSYLWARLWG